MNLKKALQQSNLTKNLRLIQIGHLFKTRGRLIYPNKSPSKELRFMKMMIFSLVMHHNQKEYTIKLRLRKLNMFIGYYVLGNLTTEVFVLKTSTQKQPL